MVMMLGANAAVGNDDNYNRFIEDENDNDYNDYKDKELNNVCLPLFTMLPKPSSVSVA